MPGNGNLEIFVDEILLFLAPRFSMSSRYGRQSDVACNESLCPLDIFDIDATPMARASGPGSKTPRSGLRTGGSRATKTPGSARTASASNAAQSSVIVAVAEGRGAARGEVGLTIVDLKSPNVCDGYMPPCLASN